MVYMGRGERKPYYEVAVASHRGIVHIFNARSGMIRRIEGPDQAADDWTPFQARHEMKRVTLKKDQRKIPKGPAMITDKPLGKTGRPRKHPKRELGPKGRPPIHRFEHKCTYYKKTGKLRSFCNYHTAGGPRQNPCSKRTFTPYTTGGVQYVCAGNCGRGSKSKVWVRDNLWVCPSCYEKMKGR